MDPLSTVNFRCIDCSHRFEAEPESVVDDPDFETHPFQYHATCPKCGGSARQAAWERSLMLAHGKATGPKTPEGKAKVAANLAGYPTPEQQERARFNALKHGLYARVATFFPAKPGRYPHCDGCEHRPGCGHQKHCLKRAELFLKHHIAFETRDPSLLSELRADTQAGIQALINDMILTIAQDGGPRLLTPEWIGDKDGGIHLVRFRDEDTGEFRQIYKSEAHPLLKHLMDYISKNTMTLADMGMTPKVIQQEEEERGHLEDKRKAREGFSEFQQRQIAQQERLMQLIERGAPPAGRVINGDGDDG